MVNHSHSSTVIPTQGGLTHGQHMHEKLSRHYSAACYGKTWEREREQFFKIIWNELTTEFEEHWERERETWSRGGTSPQLEDSILRTELIFKWDKCMGNSNAKSIHYIFAVDQLNSSAPD